MCARADDAFRMYCLADLTRHRKFCRAHGLMDGRYSLLLDVFRENFKKTEPEWALGVSAVVSAASHFATIHEYLGENDKARQYLWLGGHEWNYQGIDYPSAMGDGHVLRMKNLADRIIRADDLVLQQLPAAICSDRIGDTEKAGRLYGWVARLRDIPDRGYSRFISSFSGREGCHEVWGRKTERAYALACLGLWEKASREVRGACEWVERDPNPKGDHAWRNHFWLLQALSMMIEYKIDPSDLNLAAARKRLNPRILASGDHLRAIFLLFYLFNLRTKFAELAR
jgi:hypothetical protein